MDNNIKFKSLQGAVNYRNTLDASIKRQLQVLDNFSNQVEQLEKKINRYKSILGQTTSKRADLQAKFDETKRYRDEITEIICKWEGK